MRNAQEVLAHYQAKIDDKERELAALKSEMVGVQKVLDKLAVKLDPSNAAGPPRQWPNVKAIVIDALREAGAKGTNAAKIVDAAARRNEALKQSTVSSMLSRFKAEGVATYDGHFYRLKD